MEIVVVLAVVAALAAILAPMVTDRIQQGRLQGARSDLRTVADALLSVQGDLGDFPIFRAGSTRTLDEASTFDVLMGPGRRPPVTGTGWPALDPTADADSLSNQLIRNRPGYPANGRFAWRGPYIDELAPDPWGNAYLVNAENLRPAQPHAAFVLSAGPDEVVQTDFDLDRTSDQVLPAGDDLIHRVR